jgi:hypothetical protein
MVVNLDAVRVAGSRAGVILIRLRRAGRRGLGHPANLSTGEGPLELPLPYVFSITTAAFLVPAFIQLSRVSCFHRRLFAITLDKYDPEVLLGHSRWYYRRFSGVLLEFFWGQDYSQSREFLNNAGCSLLN